MNIRRFVILLLCVLAPALAAEVYYLTPRGRFGGAAGRRIGELAGATPLLTEPVNFNGVDTELKVGVVPRKLAELLLELKRNYPELAMKAGRDTVLLKLPVYRKFRERVLLVGDDARGNVTVFSLLLPEKMPALPDWPKELPLPAGSKPEEIIYFKTGKAYYGAVSNAGDPKLALPAITAQLKADGYLPATGEAMSLAPAARGEVFLRDKPPALLWVSFDDAGNGIVSMNPL